MIANASGVSGWADYGFSSLVRSGVQPAKRAEGRETKNSEDSSSGQVGELTPEQQRQLQKLKQVDRQVREHERAHVSVGGDLVRGGASYTYQAGPDSKRYAVAGEVSIDISPAQTPEETIPKAQHIRETALAPADPSAQDRSVAAHATRMENEARRDLSVQKRDEGGSGSTPGRSRVVFYPDFEGSLHSDEVGTNLNIFA